MLYNHSQLNIFCNHAVIDRNLLARNCVGTNLHRVDDRSAQTQYFIYNLCFRFWKHDAENNNNDNKVHFASNSTFVCCILIVFGKPFR